MLREVDKTVLPPLNIVDHSPIIFPVGPSTQASEEKENSVGKLDTGVAVYDNNMGVEVHERPILVA